MWLGSIEKVGTIPPQSAHFSASECKVRLRPGCEEVQVVASLPHAHSTGVAVWSELYNRSADGELTYVRLPDITLQPLVCRLLHRIGAARLCNRAAVDTCRERPGCVPCHGIATSMHDVLGPQLHHAAPQDVCTESRCATAPACGCAPAHNAARWPLACRFKTLPERWISASTASTPEDFPHH